MEPRDMTFDLERAVKEGCVTRDGRPVRILCTDRVGAVQWTVTGLVLTTLDDAKNELIDYWDTLGNNARYRDTDLQNLPRKHVRYVNVYEAGNPLVCFTRAQADRHALPGRLGCNRIELEERFDE